MSTRFAYSLAVIFILSLFVVLPSLFIYRQYAAHKQIKFLVAAHEAEMKSRMAQAEARQNAHQDH